MTNLKQIISILEQFKADHERTWRFSQLEKALELLKEELEKSEF